MLYSVFKFRIYYFLTLIFTGLYYNQAKSGRKKAFFWSGNVSESHRISNKVREYFLFRLLNSLGKILVCCLRNLKNLRLLMIRCQESNLSLDLPN